MSGEMFQIFVVFVTILGLGSALHVEVWPQVVNELVTEEVTVQCSPNDSPYWTQSVIIVELGKTGQSPIAILQKHDLKFGKNMEARMTVRGHINEINITESILKITIKEPRASDSGQYECKIFYMDVEGVLKEGKAYANVTVDNDNDKVVHVHLLERLSELEKQLRDMEDHTKEKDAKVETELQHQTNRTDAVQRQHAKDIDTLKTQLAKDIDTLKTQHEKDHDTLKTQHEKDIDTLKAQHTKDIDTLKTQDVKENEEINSLKKQLEKDIATLKTQHAKGIDTLMTQNVKQNEEMNALKNQLKTFTNQTSEHITKANLQSGFMAGLKSGDYLLYQKTIKFRDVQLNIGNHFDGETSQYTAPWDGLYTFYLSVVIQSGKYCNLHIRRNGVTAVQLLDGGTGIYNPSSVSALLSLKAGDVVDIYGSGMTGSTTLYAYSYPITYFSGFLIKAT